MVLFPLLVVAVFAELLYQMMGIVYLPQPNPKF